jgi:hypothetical protein
MAAPSALPVDQPTDDQERSDDCCRDQEAHPRSVRLFGLSVNNSPRTIRPSATHPWVWRTLLRGYSASALKRPGRCVP